jgi:hypothetical protein
MNLRWLKKADGQKVLQMMSYNAVQWSDEWEDIPTVEEPRQAREFNIYQQVDKFIAYPPHMSILEYKGTTPPSFICRVREVLGAESDTMEPK